MVVTRSFCLVAGEHCPLALAGLERTLKACDIQFFENLELPVPDGCEAAAPSAALPRPSRVLGAHRLASPAFSLSITHLPDVAHQCVSFKVMQLETSLERRLYLF